MAGRKETSEDRYRFEPDSSTRERIRAAFAELNPKGLTRIFNRRMRELSGQPKQQIGSVVLQSPKS